MGVLLCLGYSLATISMTFSFLVTVAFKNNKVHLPPGLFAICCMHCTWLGVTRVLTRSLTLL